MDNGRRGRSRVVTLVGIAIALALVWITLTTIWMWRYQERVVFQPPFLIADAPAPAVRMDFAASDGHAIYGYLVTPVGVGAQPKSNSQGTVVVSFHGNADLAAWLVPWGQELAERAGVSVLLAEYRGYGGIPGSPTYVSASSDALGALEFTRDSLRAQRIVLFGHSLGSAIAADVAAAMGERGAPPSALVLQSPFTSAREMATRMLVPPIPGLWRRISRIHYDTRAIVARLEAPVSVAHGTRDVVIPVRMGQQTFNAARHRGELLIVEGAGHNDLADVAGERYWRWLTAAVTSDSTKRDGQRMTGNW
jgi:pimeloyl-ACP methyl ester carboxylesterase